ncbi:hypothetical protein PISMIDRAFT_674667, partial [Pisolithus microcarpus 441]
MSPLFTDDDRQTCSTGGFGQLKPSCLSCRNLPSTGWRYLLISNIENGTCLGNWTNGIFPLPFILPSSVPQVRRCLRLAGFFDCQVTSTTGVICDTEPYVLIALL